MEANQQSIVSRVACVGLVGVWLAPIVEYLGGMEPTRKAPIQIVMMAFKRDHPPYLMAIWFLPAILALLRLSGVAWRAHFGFAAVGVFLGIFEFLLAALGQGNPTMSHWQVYFGIEGVVPAVHWGFHAGISGGVSAAWFFDELWAMRTFKPIDR